MRYKFEFTETRIELKERIYVTTAAAATTAGRRGGACDVMDNGRYVRASDDRHGDLRIVGMDMMGIECVNCGKGGVGPWGPFADLLCGAIAKKTL